MNGTDRRIRTAALRLFAKHGYHGTGIRDIAQAADVTTSTLYHHAADKYELLMEIMRGVLGQLITNGTRAVAASPDPVTQVAALMEMHVIAHTNEPEAAVVVDHEWRVLQGSRRDEIMTLRARYENIWRAVIGEGVRKQVFVVPDERLIRLALLELGNGVAYWYKPYGPSKPEEIASIYADLALGMLSAQGVNGRLVVADLDLPDPKEWIAEPINDTHTIVNAG